MIELAHTTLTHDFFWQHGSNADLLLWSGHHLAADLHFQGAYNAGQFAVTDSGGSAFVSFDPTDSSHATIGAPTRG
jgi:hypothetical protein